jgi:hypothetical protein
MSLWFSGGDKRPPDRPPYAGFSGIVPREVVHELRSRELRLFVIRSFVVAAIISDELNMHPRDELVTWNLHSLGH